MLVTDSQACHLLCYTVRGGSLVFNIPLHKQWCNQMLHWVSELNTHYITKGIAPPANVFWEQDSYKAFVQLTKEACEALNSSGVEVPSRHGSETGPLFNPVLHVDDDVVPNTPEADSTQLSQQQQLQGQKPQQPPQWQQQQQPMLSRTAGTSAGPEVFHNMQLPTGPASAPPLRLLAAAAIPLPDEDTTMTDAEPLARYLGGAAQPQGQEAQGNAKQPQDEYQSGPIGPHGLASWMQHFFHRFSVDLKSVLDTPCQKALSLLAAADVVGALERIAKDVKAGWPHNASAVCMRRISHLTPPSAPAASPGAATTSPGAAITSPGTPAASPGAVAVGPQAALRSPGLPAPSPGAAPTKPRAPFPSRSVPTPGQQAAPTSVTPAFQSPSLAVPDPGPAASSPPAGVKRPGWPSSAPKMVTPRLALASPSNVCPAQMPATTAQGPHGLSHTVTSTAQRQLWPDTAVSDTARIGHRLNAGVFASEAGPASIGLQVATLYAAAPGPAMEVQQANQAPRTAAVGFSPGAGTSRAGAVAGSPAQNSAPVPALSSTGQFGGRPFPAIMSPVVKSKLCAVVARHHVHLRAEDFDGSILARLAHMPECRAMSIMQQADDANWSDIRDNTRLIMSWCCK